MLPSYKTSVDYMSKAFKEFPWDNKLAYAQYLAQTYYYVCHSTRLLAASAARFSQEDQAFHRRFLKHTDEENSHELLAIRDLQKLGYNIKDFPELAQTRTFYETQYYKIEHIDPAALMGYILALETMAARELKGTCEKLNELYGRECVKFLNVHNEEDPDHVDKAIEVIEKLSAERRVAIDHNLEQTAISYADMMQAAKVKAYTMDFKKVA